MKRPMIGVLPLWDEKKDSLWMLPGYMQGLEQAGGLPVMLPLTEDAETIHQIAGSMDGFLFTGGQDVCPSVYGQSVLPECGQTCPQRDAMELSLLRAVLSLDVPVLGICRGIQLLCAALGGTLYQDLPSQRPSEICHCQTPPYEVPVHTVRLCKDEPLYDLLQTEQLPVNSYHHQAVQTLPAGLRTMAVSEDGLIEAAFMPAKRFVWAVQWHPEFSYQTDRHSQQLFAAFVQAAQTQKNPR